MDIRQIYKTIIALSENNEITECPSAPEQQSSSNVSMNVNMTAQGASSIRELMQVLQNLDDTPDTTDSVDLMSLPGELTDFDSDKDDLDRAVIDDSYSNSADRTVTMGVDAITVTGDDMHSKGGPEPRKPAGGANPYRTVDEGIVRRLNSLYREIKSRQ